MSPEAVKALRMLHEVANLLATDARLLRAGARLRHYVRVLEAELNAMQAYIDALMLEYCPDEMTPEQVATWAAHQQRVEPDAAGSYESAAKVRDDMQQFGTPGEEH